MSSTPTGKALLLIRHVLSLHHFLQSSIPHNLGVASKVTTLATDSMFFFADRLLHLQAVFRVAPKKCHFGRRLALHKLVIARDDLYQEIDEPHRKDHQQSNRKISGLPTYDIWSLGCILYHRLFGSSIYNFDCQKINSLIYFYIALLPFHCNIYAFTLRLLRHI